MSSISGHPLKAVKQELQARRQCEELWLQFLTPDEVGLYLDARYPRHQFPSELGRAVHRNTDGNPLFIVNMVDYLVAQGVIAEVDGCWRLRTAVEEIGRGVPESLRQLIEKHIERLSEEQQRLLEVASVAGREFSAAAVAAGLETTVEQVEEACEGLVRRGQFLQAHGPGVLPDGTIAGRYGFLHTLYQGVLYERLPAVRRMRLHRRVGESEERLYGSRAGEIAAELAVHFERGQDAQRAITYLQQAADNVLHRYAHREAIGYQQRALALLQTLPDTQERAQQELVLQVARGVSLSVTEGFGIPEVERAYARARELCQRIGNLPTLVPILYGLWNFYLVRAEFQPTRELAAQMLALAEREQDPAFLLAAHNAQTQTLFEQEDLAAAHWSQLKRCSTLFVPVAGARGAARASA
jgi:predicted ATPase